MPAGLGGSGYVAWTFETTMGTYLPPTTAGTVFMPILDESLAYQEDKYMSEQIRQSTIISEVNPSYYSVSGDITVEVDPKYVAYMLFASRHTITKTGATAPFVYKFVPSNAGSASTGTGVASRSASITIVRNGIGFGYAGCVLGGYSFTIEDGTLRMTANVLGLSETTPGALGTPSWAASLLYGADASDIYVAASAVSPTWGSPVLDFNGFTFTSDFNAEAQNRIRSDRSASYISYGATEATFDTELDFVNKTEYDNMKNTTSRAVRLLSRHPNSAATVTAADDALEIAMNRTVYETYEVGLGGMGDLIMAGVTGRVVGIAGGDPYAISVKTTADIL